MAQELAEQSVLESAERLAQELAEQLVLESAERLAQELAEQLVRELAERLVQELAVQLAQELAERLVLVAQELVQVLGQRYPKDRYSLKNYCPCCQNNRYPYRKEASSSWNLK